MKMQLLGTTAIVGAALLFAGPAVAQNWTGGGKAATVTLTGSLDFQAGFIDQDKEGGGDLGTPDRGYSFITNSELAINARGKTDAGMKWRGKIELETDTDATGNTDEMALTLSGSWGALVIGNEDGPEDLMDYGADQANAAASGGVSGDWKDFTNTGTVNDRLMVEATLGGDVSGVDSSDATKIVYYTPRINGLQLGVGFVPDTGGSGDGKSPDNVSGQAEEFFGLGVNYVQKFDGFNVAIGATGSIADSEDDALEDVRAWRVGGVLGFGSWKIGAGYQDIGDSLEDKTTGDGDATEFDVLVGFKQGPIKVSVGYLHAEVETSDGDDEHDVVTLGASYTLGKGLVVYADTWWYSSERAAGADDSGDDNDAFGLLIGTTVKF